MSCIVNGKHHRKEGYLRCYNNNVFQILNNSYNTQSGFSGKREVAQIM